MRILNKKNLLVVEKFQKKNVNQESTFLGDQTTLINEHARESVVKKEFSISIFTVVTFNGVESSCPIEMKFLYWERVEHFLFYQKYNHLQGITVLSLK